MPELPSFSVQGPTGSMLVLFSEATESQRHQCFKLAASGLGPPLSEDEYTERDELMAKQKLECHVWCAFNADDANQVIATCRTLHRDLLVNDDRGKLQERRGACLDMVITTPQYRGHGIASFMLESIASWFDKQGIAASILYSTKADFYAAKGWHPVPAFDYRLSLDSFKDVPTVLDLPAIKTLDQKNVPELCERDIDSIEEAMQSQSIRPGDPQMAILPAADLIHWLHTRASFMSLKINGRSRLSEGAMTSDNSTWALWHHDFRKKGLYIPRIRSFIPDEATRTRALVAVVVQACIVAKAWQFDHVAIWDASPEVQPAVEFIRAHVDLGIGVTGGVQGERLSVRFKGGETKSFTRFDELGIMSYSS